MKKLIPWLFFTLILAVGLHLFGMWYLPNYLTKKTVDGIYKRRGSWLVNQIGYGGLRFAGTDTVVRDNPDTVTSFAVYDVSEKPMRVRCVIPDRDNYWSLSLFAWNTDNYFVVNDRTAKSKDFELVIVKSGSKYQNQGQEEIVVSPSEKGIFLIRMIVTNRDDKDEIARLAEVQKKTTIQLIDNVQY
ncbi:MAG: DUF1254 domain-containing protein [Acidobacteria bacterium]|nr:DUF1254 domain-containing protein [Acidobacteriota bacterium]